MFLLTRYFPRQSLRPPAPRRRGIVGLRRVLISAGAGVASVAMLLPRVFHKKFADLDAFSVPEPYRQALVADELLIVSLMAMLAAFVAALAAPSMFPDEVDYVSLTPLPLPRRRIFGAKLLALFVFAGAFILAGVALVAISFPIFTDGQWAEHGKAARSFSLAGGGHGRRGIFFSRRDGRARTRAGAPAARMGPSRLDAGAKRCARRPRRERAVRLSGDHACVLDLDPSRRARVFSARVVSGIAAHDAGR
jgi:hypothetical protein